MLVENVCRSEGRESVSSVCEVIGHDLGHGKATMTAGSSAHISASTTSWRTEGLILAPRSATKKVRNVCVFVFNLFRFFTSLGWAILYGNTLNKFCSMKNKNFLALTEACIYQKYCLYVTSQKCEFELITAHASNSIAIIESKNHRSL